MEHAGVTTKPLRGRACPAWSPQEDQVLRTRWTVGGYEAVRDLLPRRTYAAIVTRASTLRVKSMSGSKA